MFAQGKRHVLKHRQIGEQGAKLKQHAHASARRVELGLVHWRDILPVEQHLTGPGPVLTTDQAQDGGFAATRCAHERSDLATRYRHGNIVQNHLLTVTKGEISQFNKGFGIGGHLGC